MEKKEWNKCNKCGVVTDTDPDVTRCPACGNDSFTRIWLDREEVKELIKAKKFYTKHIALAESWLFNKNKKVYL